MSYPDNNYSEPATIKAIRTYYQFLTRLYLPVAAIKAAPPGGWPAITRKTFRALGKSDTVVSLLANLPYPSQDGCDFQNMDEIEVAGHCRFADWRSQVPSNEHSNSEDIRREVGLVTEGQVWDRVPPHVVGLTTGGREKSVMLLDMRRGVVYWLNAPTALVDHYDGRLDELAPTKVRFEDEAWEFAGDAAMWSVQGFFEMLKEEFRTLRMVPVRTCQVLDVYTQYIGIEELVTTFQAVFRDQGWPEKADGFNKDVCLAEVQRKVEEFFPGEIAFSEHLGSDVRGTLWGETI
ncbi:hypothetical protein N0V93_004671 [Gnomoniopsis smithogilvyi]|uniref:Uncharacterized protein n=1 Tax=Gnomoniopsis smithogilvyi TaxID=1191159 RepID=A0A9W8YRH0_9PEZI|nr:hypothetical protein N0V93_004671 [Gnomoniopsis smithogilvyi]